MYHPSKLTLRKFSAYGTLFLLLSCFCFSVFQSGYYYAKATDISGLTLSGDGVTAQRVNTTTLYTYVIDGLNSSGVNLYKAVIESGSSFPSGIAGRMFYRSDLAALYYYNGSWVACSSYSSDLSVYLTLDGSRALTGNWAAGNGTLGITSLLWLNSTSVSATNYYMGNNLVSTQQPYSYLIYVSDSNGKPNPSGGYYAAKNGTDGTVVNSWTSTVGGDVVNSAITNAANGDYIFVKNGTYLFSSTAVVNGKTLTIEGENKETVVFKLNDSANCRLMVVGNVSTVPYFELSGITFDANEANQPEPASFFTTPILVLSRATNYYVHDAKFLNAIGHTFYIPSTFYPNGTVERCEIAYGNGGGIEFLAAGTTVLRDNYIHNLGANVTDSGGSFGIKFASGGVGKVWVQNNVVCDNNGTGITVYKRGPPAFIQNNDVRGNRVMGIYCDGNSGSDISHNNVDGNGGNGINIAFSSGDKVKDNNVVNTGVIPTLGSILTYWEQRGIIADHCNESEVSGNYAVGNGQAGIHYWGTCYNNLITGNTLGNNGQNLTHSDQEAFGVRFLINGTAYNNTISNNIFFDNQTAPTQTTDIRLSCTGTIINFTYIENNKMVYGYSNTTNVTNIIARFNTGFKSENSGLASFNGDGATTVFNITHGLSKIPTFYSITGVTNDSQQGITWIPFNAKIADITEDDTDAHTFALAAPLSETRRIASISLKCSRVTGTGSFYVYPNEGSSFYSYSSGNSWGPIAVASGTQRFQYSLSVANDDWDIYCLGYTVGNTYTLSVNATYIIVTFDYAPLTGTNNIQFTWSANNY